MKDKIVYKVFSAFIYFDIFFILMTVVPPSDHLFVIFIFDDAVFSHGRSGSVSGNVVDAIINVIVIIVFFFLFSVDIKAVYKFIIESLFKIMKMFELLFRKKIKDLIHPSLSELFIGNKRKVLHFIFFGIKSFFTNKAVDMGIPFQIPAKGVKNHNKSRSKILGFIEFVKHTADHAGNRVEKAVKKIGIV